MTVNALVFFNFFLAKEFYTVLSDCCSESVLFSAEKVTGGRCVKLTLRS